MISTSRYRAQTNARKVIIQYKFSMRSANPNSASGLVQLRETNPVTSAKAYRMKWWQNTRKFLNIVRPTYRSMLRFVPVIYEALRTNVDAPSSMLELKRDQMMMPRPT